MLSSPTEVETSGPSLRLVLGGVASLTLLFGVLSYKRFAESERSVVEGMALMAEAGKKLDAEGCIDEVIGWFHACGDQGSNAAVCLQGVSLTMFHCLAAQRRDATCEFYVKPRFGPDGRVDHGDWVFMECNERGNLCAQKKECACADAYRALQSFCLTGQTSVQVRL